MSVIMPIFEGCFVNVEMGMPLFTVGVLVFDVIVLMAEVGVLVSGCAVVVPVGVRASVFMRFIHLAAASLVVSQWVVVEVVEL